MNRYPDELDRLSFTRAQKEALIERLTEERPGKTRRRPPYRAAVALAAAISLLAGAAAGASLARLSPEFLAIFGAADETEMTQLGAVTVNQTFADRNGSGASITVREMAADQTQLYVLLDFTAPEGVVLAEQPDRSASDRGYGLLGDNGVSFDLSFYTDETCTQRVFPSIGYAYGAVDLADDDPTDNVLPLLLTATVTSDFKDARYFRCTGINRLVTYQGEAGSVPVVENLDISFTLPLPQPTACYSFTGRSSVKLGGTTMAVVENLTISPISVTMDLIVPESSMDAYCNTESKEDAWPVYVLMSDGTKVSASFGGYSASTNIFRTDDGVPFFCAYHVGFTLERPIDVGQIQDIVFAGDNDPEKQGSEDGTIYFSFGPNRFDNDAYWNEVHYIWKDR